MQNVPENSTLSNAVALSEPGSNGASNGAANGESNGASSEAPGTRLLSPDEAQAILVSAQAAANAAPGSDMANAVEAATEAAPAPKRRGRPPKNPVPVDGEAPARRTRAAAKPLAEGEEAPAPKRRGRPPKNAAPVAAAPEELPASAPTAGSAEAQDGSSAPQPQAQVLESARASSPEPSAAGAPAAGEQLSLDVSAPAAQPAQTDERASEERQSEERSENRERPPFESRGQNRGGERPFERGENRSLRFRERPENRPENRPEGRPEGRREGFAPGGFSAPGFVPSSGPNVVGPGWREEFGPNGTRLISPQGEAREAEARPEAREARPEARPDARPEGRPDNREGRLEPRPESRGFENRGRNGEGREGRFEAREDNRGRGDNRNDHREGRGERPEGRGENRNDRFGRDRNGRDGGREGRDGNRGEGREGGRDGGRGQNDPRERGLDRIEREALRARPELETAALEALSLEDLRRIVGEMGEANAENMGRDELVFRGLELQAQAAGMAFKRGLLEILGDGRGFLRTEGYLSSDGDVYVSSSQIKRFNLKTGDLVSGQARPPKGDERHHGLLRVESINGASPEEMKARKEFEKLTPVFPDERFRLETSQENVTARIIDLVSPIGKGQRGLIVAPPKAGKTTLLKNIANSISRNHPEIEMIVLLIDERPEEVTDISRSVRGEVVASTFDETAENHMRVAEMVFEKAKRMVEQKKDVVVLLDSLTRLSRAANLVVAPSGRTMSGGLDPAAMHKPKKMFGAARNIEEGGSLTILATVLVDTGSRMDEYIFEEFKGTGNMDLVLDRNLFDQRVFPAIDINKSGTRRDDLLMTKEDLAATFHLRRTLAQLDNDKAITLLLDRLRNTKTNIDFMQIVARSASKGAVQQP